MRVLTAYCFARSEAPRRQDLQIPKAVPLASSTWRNGILTAVGRKIVCSARLTIPDRRVSITPRRSAAGLKSAYQDWRSLHACPLRRRTDYHEQNAPICQPLGCETFPTWSPDSLLSLRYPNAREGAYVITEEQAVNSDWREFGTPANRRR
jgi:hypothetical protein